VASLRLDAHAAKAIPVDDHLHSPGRSRYRDVEDHLDAVALDFDQSFIGEGERERLPDLADEPPLVGEEEARQFDGRDVRVVAPLELEAPGVDC
jgi:hypothetical protein